MLETGLLIISSIIIISFMIWGVVNVIRAPKLNRILDEFWAESEKTVEEVRSGL